MSTDLGLNSANPFAAFSLSCCERASSNPHDISTPRGKKRLVKARLLKRPSVARPVSLPLSALSISSVWARLPASAPVAAYGAVRPACKQGRQTAACTRRPADRGSRVDKRDKIPHPHVCTSLPLSLLSSSLCVSAPRSASLRTARAALTGHVQHADGQTHFRGPSVQLPRSRRPPCPRACYSCLGKGQRPQRSARAQPAAIAAARRRRRPAGRSPRPDPVTSPRRAAGAAPPPGRPLCRLQRRRSARPTGQRLANTVTLISCRIADHLSGEAPPTGRRLGNSRGPWCWENARPRTLAGGVACSTAGRRRGS